MTVTLSTEDFFIEMTQTVVSNRLSLKSEPNWYPVSARRGRAVMAAVRFLGARDWRRKLGWTPRP